MSLAKQKSMTINQTQRTRYVDLTPAGDVCHLQDPNGLKYDRPICLEKTSREID